MPGWNSECTEGDLAVATLVACRCRKIVIDLHQHVAPQIEASPDHYAQPSRLPIWKTAPQCASPENCPVAVDRSIEDARGSKTVEPQGAEECQRAPVAVRSKAAQAFAAWSPAAQRCHVGLDPGFVDEHQPFRIETRLPGTPALSSAGKIGASLLKGE